jgi:hypothetical protein
MVAEVLPTYARAATKSLTAFWLRAEEAVQVVAADPVSAFAIRGWVVAAAASWAVVVLGALAQAWKEVVAAAERRRLAALVAAVVRAIRGPANRGAMGRFTKAATAARGARVVATAVTTEAEEVAEAATMVAAAAALVVVRRTMVALAAAAAAARRT